jgi:drug efflux transport system ATP-binding protein
LIRDLARTGHTIFVTTHYMDEAEYCDRVALMYRGKIIALGAPAELKRDLLTHKLLRLDTSAPLDTMRAVEQLAGILDIAVFGGGLHVVVDDVDASMERIRKALTEKQIEIRRLEQITPSLEDVFVGLIEAEERKAA